MIKSLYTILSVAIINTKFNSLNWQISDWLPAWNFYKNYHNKETFSILPWKFPLCSEIFNRSLFVHPINLVIKNSWSISITWAAILEQKKSLSSVSLKWVVPFQFLFHKVRDHFNLILQMIHFLFYVWRFEITNLKLHYYYTQIENLLKKLDQNFFLINLS